MGKLIVDLRYVRKEGWVLPRFRACMYIAKRGVLVLREEHVKDFSRTMRIARLVTTTGAPNADVPPLYDATLAWCDGSRLILTGFERLEVGVGRWIDYAQSWDAEIVAE